jgi:hypothetical protein
MSLMSNMFAEFIDRPAGVFRPITVAIVAGLVAIVVRALLRQYFLRVDDDRVRLESAITALDAQKAKLQSLLENPYIPNPVKVFLLDLSTLMGDRDVARRTNDWALEEGDWALEEGQSNKRSRDSDGLNDWDGILKGRGRVLESLRIAKPSLELLRKNERKLFQDVNAVIRGAFVTMMLQWPETTKGLHKIVYRFATESPGHTFAWAMEEHRPQKREETKITEITDHFFN